MIGVWIVRIQIKVQRRITSFFIRLVMGQHIKKRYFKRGLIPTSAQVIQDINPDSLNTLTKYGTLYVDDIKAMAEDIIGRHK